MSKRSLPLALAPVLIAALAPALPSGSAVAQEPGLVGESVAAIERLVSGEAKHCSLRDAADADPGNGVEIPYVFCDDGVPPRGGGANGVPVPAKYAATDGNDWAGLPPPASEQETAEAQVTDDIRPEGENRITLDVDVTLPASASIATEYAAEEWDALDAPPGGFPVIVFMHGCCSGNKNSWEAATVDAAREQWHHSNAWFASRGYVVITYTARGFRNSNDQGSTGTTQLDSRRYEINDYQYLVGLLADSDAERRAAGKEPLFNVNPKKVAAVGGSYGGGFAWMALTDPTWTSPATGRKVKLATVVTKYGWTDLVESLLPSGHYKDVARSADGGSPKTWIAPTDPAKAPSRNPIGVEKQSIVAGLYGTGNAVATNHTTFPEYVHDAYARLQVGEPYDGDPNLEQILQTFLADRSAYFQQSFWKRVKRGLEVPVYSAGTWTDPLFPTMEHLRFYNKLKQLNPRYPVASYYGDYQHFAQNKAKEWDDMCGEDHHVCTIDDYRVEGKPLKLDSAPNRVRVGINTRISRFLDHFLYGKRKRPRMNVRATTTICPANATEHFKADEPGAEYVAPTWRALAPRSKVFGWEGGGMVSSAAVDNRAPESDPVARDRQSNKCYTTSQASPGPGVAQFTAPALEEPLTMMGLPTLRLEYEGTGVEYWIGARLFDKAPDGTSTLVTRGVCRVNTRTHPDQRCERFDLFGNGWIFEKGHSVVVEVTQADSPFLRKSNDPSSITISSANVRLPVSPLRLRKDFRE